MFSILTTSLFTCCANTVYSILLQWLSAKLNSRVTGSHRLQPGWLMPACAKRSFPLCVRHPTGIWPHTTAVPHGMAGLDHSVVPKQPGAQNTVPQCGEQIPVPQCGVQSPVPQCGVQSPVQQCGLQTASHPLVLVPAPTLGQLA